MTSRDLMTLVLRCIGFWTVIRALSSLTSALANVLAVIGAAEKGYDWPDAVKPLHIIFTSCVQPAVELAVAVVLLVGAEKISNFFYRKAMPTDSGRLIEVAPADLYRTFAGLLGLYAFLWSVRPLSHVAARLAWWPRHRRLTEHDFAQFLQAALYLACAFGMIFGADRITRCLLRLKYVRPGVPDAETPPESDNGTWPAGPPP